jgi:hypothetical protein
VPKPVAVQIFLNFVFVQIILDVAACLMVKHASKEEMGVWQVARIESLFKCRFAGEASLKGGD